MDTLHIRESDIRRVYDRARECGGNFAEKDYQKYRAIYIAAAQASFYDIGRTVVIDENK